MLWTHSSFFFFKKKKITLLVSPFYYNTKKYVNLHYPGEAAPDSVLLQEASNSY